MSFNFLKKPDPTFREQTVRGSDSFISLFSPSYLGTYWPVHFFQKNVLMNNGLKPGFYQYI
jgi:hypothetical protein